MIKSKSYHKNNCLILYRNFWSMWKGEIISIFSYLYKSCWKYTLKRINVKLFFSFYIFSFFILAKNKKEKHLYRKYGYFVRIVLSICDTFDESQRFLMTYISVYFDDYISATCVIVMNEYHSYVSTGSAARVRSFSYFCRLYPVVLIRSCFPAIHSRHFFLPLYLPSFRLVFTEAPRWLARMQLLLHRRVSFQTPRSFFRKLSFQMFITEITRTRLLYASSA